MTQNGDLIKYSALLYSHCLNMNLVKKLVWFRGAQKCIVSWGNKHSEQVASTTPPQRKTIVYEKHVQNKDLSSLLWGLPWDSDKQAEERLGKGKNKWKHKSASKYSWIRPVPSRNQYGPRTSWSFSLGEALGYWHMQTNQGFLRVCKCQSSIPRVALSKWWRELYPGARLQQQPEHLLDLQEE